MPTYRFPIIDGGTYIPDNVGVVLPDDASAVRYAERVVRELTAEGAALAESSISVVRDGVEIHRIKFGGK